MKKIFYAFSLVIIFSCSNKNESITFKEVTSEVGINTENNWKYGGPTIADINNDGRFDLLLGNHDNTPIQLFWANKDNTYTEQKGLYPKSDLHGMAAGDYDKDGDLDLLISLGGGNGATPQPQRLLRNDNGVFTDATKEAGISEMGARGRSVRWIDLDNDGDLDFLQINAEQMVNEEIPRNILFENNGNGTFTYRKSEAFENIDAERLLITDFNNDGILDLLTFSPYSATQFWQGNNDFTFTNQSKTWLPEELQNSIQVQTVAQVDIDNDGDLDYYLARGKSYYQIANNAISFDEKLKRLDLRDEGNKSKDGITFFADGDIELSDFYRFPRGPEKPSIPLFIGDSKTEHKMPFNSIKVTQEEAKGFPEVLDKSGWYLGYLGNGEWRFEWLLKTNLAWDVRASVLGVTKIKTDWEPQNLGVADVLLINEGTYFKDGSSALPKESLENNWGITTADFDNDGFNDFFLYRFGGLIQRVEDVIFKNKGNLTFKSISTHGANHIPAKSHGDMGAAFDYNLDGKIDVFSGDDDNGQWHLYENTSENENNYVSFRVGNSKSDVDPYGAKVIITTASSSQYKLVGSSSASHSQSLINSVHFGIGKNDKILKVEIVWRNGDTEILQDLEVNKLYEIPSNNSTDDLDFAKMLKGVAPDNILYDQKEYFNWGSSIVKGEDGKYHLFYAQMPRDLGFSTWLNDGVISRAVADKPEGPYTHQETVLKGRGLGFWDETTAHNPWIQKYNDKYYLYYMSSNYSGKKLNKQQLHEARTKWIDNGFRAMVRENQRIGVAVSESVFGPWKRFDKPQVEPSGPIEKITCNPAVTQRPDGGFLMLVRGDKPNTKELVRHQAIALSDNPKGPWEVQEKAAVGNLNAEDPAIWFDKKRERYYAIYHAFGYLGLITSEDGLNWKKARHHKIMELAYKDEKGKMIKVQRMERPFVFLENDIPKVLTVSIQQANGESYSMFIPLDYETN